MAILAEDDVIPGIKVDRGAFPMPGSRDEKITEGLDGLRQRLAHYAALGAGFAKALAGLRQPIWPKTAAEFGRCAKVCLQSGTVATPSSKTGGGGSETGRRNP